MTLREALDLLELNERTLEQSMLESSLQNRLEHTELRHVLRVFEAYRKVNAFLNPSFNTQGDARMTIIDESVPGGPMLEVTKASFPTASSAVAVKERDTFSDTMIETWSATEATMPEPKTTLALDPVAPRAAGVNLFVMLGLVAAAFSVGMVVLGPTMSLLFKRPAISASSPVPSSPVPSSPAPSSPAAVVSSRPPVVAAPPVAAAVAAPPVAPVVTPPASVARPAPPVVVKPVVPAAPLAPAKSAPVKQPVAAAITKPAVRPTVTKQPPVVRAEPRVTPRPRAATPRNASRPRVTVQPRVTPQPRATPRRTTLTPRALNRSASVALPSRRVVNQRQFAQWDSAGVVLRYRSWNLVPDAVRGLSATMFKAAIFVARDPASLPDIQR